MNALYYGIDGTGPFFNKKYQTKFDSSFVNVFAREASWTIGRYNRGPTNSGVSTKSLGADAFSHVQQWMRTTRAAGGQAPFLCLAGYSRGGAAVIHTCKLLDAVNIPVDCLLLFDAVDRAISLFDVKQVPKNVRHVYHARRKSDTKSRGSFGNCGTSLAASQQATGPFETSGYVEKFFFGTHGAIGGLPWMIEEPEDFNDMSMWSKVKFSATPSTVPKVITGVTVGMAEKLGMVERKTPEQRKIKESWNVLSTKVTYEEDMQTALEVGAWMRRNLQAAKFGHKLRNPAAPMSPKPFSAIS